MLRRLICTAGAAVAMFWLTAGSGAKAQRFSFSYVGGPWSIQYHSGWHRWWGGPAVGYYYAPTPVYVVPNYPGPVYYRSPGYWYSGPGNGLNVYVGGGHRRHVIYHRRRRGWR